MNAYLQVALGGALGAVMRFGVSRNMPWHGAHFPIATFVVNVSGCFVMGLLAALFAHRGGHHLTPLLMTGVLGGYTTFSAFSLDALTLWQRGQMGPAAIYVAASVALSLIGVVAGLGLGRLLFA